MLEKKFCRALVACALAMAYSVSSHADLRLADSISVYSVESETGLVLFEHNSDKVRPPASMIKLMQMLLVSEGIDQGTWSLDTPIEASRHAQRMGGTQVFLHQGEVRPLGSMMQAVAVVSANDAAMAVAEALWGSEEAYLARMNERAAELGMLQSEFHSVHGLPPDRGESPDKTTARDMALLGRACVQHPQILEWTNTIGFQFRPGEKKKYTTNRLMRFMEECDGLKTGFISASGFCVTATAMRDDIRIVTVVMGHWDGKRRFNLAERLLLEGLDGVRKDRLAGSEITSAPRIAVNECETTEVALEIESDLWVTAKKVDWPNLKIVTEIPEHLTAPMAPDTVVGEIRVELEGRTLARSPVVLPVALEEAGWRWRIGRSIESFFGK